MIRHLAIGDIHGCYDALITLIEYVGIRDDDIIVVLGDYIDRGPDTRRVLDWLIEFDSTHQLVALMGNHEIMLLESRSSLEVYFHWLQFGGREALQSYQIISNAPAGLKDIPAAHWKFVKNLRSYYETTTHIYVHGIVDPQLPMGEQSEQSLFWDQYSDSFPGHQSEKVVVCGHKSQDSGLPVSNGQAICIDTAAWRGQWLSCLDVDSGTIWQANQQGDTRKLHLDELRP